MKREFFLLLCALIATGTLMGNDWWIRKPYNRWSKDECQKMMDDSPWTAAKTRQILGPDDSTDGTGVGVGINIAVGQPVTYRFRFLTAKPVRMAIARNLLIDRKNKVNQATLADFVQKIDEENIVIALEMEVGYRIEQFRNTLIELRTSDLISNTYLKTDTGKMQYLRRYDPSEDGFAAKFVFARRFADGTPFITAQDRKLYFDTDLDARKSVQVPPDFYGGPSGPNKLSIVFDLRKMIFDGKLEI
jgi:hypothetical protein